MWSVIQVLYGEGRTELNIGVPMSVILAILDYFGVINLTLVQLIFPVVVIAGIPWIMLCAAIIWEFLAWLIGIEQ